MSSGAIWVGTASAIGPHSSEEKAQPVGYREPRWYAACTSANHERRIAEQLLVRDVEHFLPTYSSLRRWKDRRITLHLPLFPGYVFVRIALRDRLRVLQVPGVARFVSFNGAAAPVADAEIEQLQSALARGMRVEPHPYLTAGRRARIKEGPLAGCEGILVRKKGNSRLVLSIDLIQRSIMVDLDAGVVEPVFHSRPVSSDCMTVPPAVSGTD